MCCVFGLCVCVCLKKKSSLTTKIDLILPYDGEKRTLEPEDMRTLEPGGGGGG